MPLFVFYLTKKDLKYRTSITKENLTFYVFFISQDEKASTSNDTNKNAGHEESSESLLSESSTAEKKEKEPEPTFEVLSNPARTMKVCEANCYSERISQNTMSRKIFKTFCGVGFNIEDRLQSIYS